MSEGKINLQYIWIKEQGCFKNFQCNFNSRYEFDYNHETGVLTCTDNRNSYMENFYDKDGNIDVTAIVGKNGTGKTTLMESILDEEFGLMNNEIALIKVYVENHSVLHIHMYGYFYFEDGPIVFYTYSKAELTVPLKFSTEEQVYTINLKERLPAAQLHNVRSSLTPMVLLDFVFDKRRYSNYNPNEKLIDISTVGFLNNEKTRILRSHKETGEKADINSKFFHTETKYQINFCKEYEDSRKLLDFSLPTAGFVYIQAGNYYAESISKQILKAMKLSEKTVEGSNTVDIIKRMFANAKGYKKNLLLSDVALSIVDKLLNYVSGNNADSRISAKAIRDSIISIYNDDKTNFDEEYYSLLKEKLLQLGENRYKREYLEKVIADADAFIKYSDDCTGSDLTNSFVGSQPFLRMPLKNSGQYDLGRFFDLYTKTVWSYDYLDFKWDINLSSGENAMLNIFSRLYSVCNDEYSTFKNASNIILLLDEADLMLHPEWQSRYLKNTIGFLKTAFKGVHVQIILATHSPIMLSDIPKQDVVYLDKDKDTGDAVLCRRETKRETFGSDIFRLYNDAFFLEDGSMGKFAREKISELVKDIDGISNNTKKSELTEIRKRIQAVGDDFLRKQLEDKYRKHVPDEERIRILKAKKRAIDEELAELEKGGN